MTTRELSFMTESVSCRSFGLSSSLLSPSLLLFFPLLIQSCPSFSLTDSQTVALYYSVCKVILLLLYGVRTMYSYSSLPTSREVVCSLTTVLTPRLSLSQVRLWYVHMYSSNYSSTVCSIDRAPGTAPGATKQHKNQE